MTDVLLFIHPTAGVLGILASVWVFVEALNASEANRSRIRSGGIIVALCFVATWAFAGYWYTSFYGVDKQAILGGPIPWAHSFFMETKEHYFFIALFLALYLPFVTRLDLARNGQARLMTMAVTTLIVLTGLCAEGAGALISFGVRLAYQPAGA